MAPIKQIPRPGVRGPAQPIRSPGAAPPAATPTTSDVLPASPSPATTAPGADDLPMPEYPTAESTGATTSAHGDHWQRIAEPIARELITSNLDVVVSATGVSPDAVRAILQDIVEQWGT